MPLKNSKSKQAFEHNFKAEMGAGKPKDQSLAIAYSVRRKASKKAKGGRVYEKHEHKDAPTGPTEYRNRNKSSDLSGGQRRGPEGYPKYQEQAQNQKGIHTPQSGVTAFPGGKGTSEAGDLAKQRYAGRALPELVEHSKKKHKEKLEEMRAMPAPKLQGLYDGGKVGGAKTSTTGNKTKTGGSNPGGASTGGAGTVTITTRDLGSRGINVSNVGGKTDSKNHGGMDPGDSEEDDMKKMASGGEVNAKNQRRPMPDNRYDDAKMVSQNSGKKPPGQDSMTSRPDIAQSQRGPKTTPIKHPKMVPQNLYSTRLRSEEDDLQYSAGVNNGPQEQPPKHDDEEGANRQGPKVPDMQDEHATHRKPYARGGMIDDMHHASKHDMEPDDHGRELQERDEEAHLLMGADPSEDEGAEDAHSRNEMKQSQSSGDPDMEREHSNGRMAYAEGGMAHEMDDQPHEEAEEEHSDSIAAAIMAKRDRMKDAIDSGARDLDEAVRMASGGSVESGSPDMNYYEGGQVEGSDEDEADIMLNGEEHPNGYYPRNEDEVLKENYMEDMRHVDQPMDSNEKGDSREDAESDKHDMVSSIRKKMMARRQFR